MLSRLRVSNLAVVEKAEVAFGPGLNVLTGETGAGKSVLMGALELVLGGRADASVVREGAKEAEVEAVFEGMVEKWSGGEVEKWRGGEVVVRRTVTAAGRSRAWIDDESVTLAELKAFGESLVDIHGPRANQKILEEGFQREALDSYAGLGAAAAGGRRRTDGAGRRAAASAAHFGSDYAAAWVRLQEIRAARAALEEGGDVSDEIDLLRYQTGELEAARLTEEDNDLASRHAAAAHAGEILEAAGEVTEGLGGDEGAADRLGRLQGVLASLARRLPEAEAWCREAEELTVRIQELSRTVADTVSALDADPGLLEELDARLSLVNKLQRKYAAGGTVSDLLSVLETKRARLAELEGRGAKLEELAREEKAAADAVRQAGAKLTAARRAASERLAKRVTKTLADLGFRQAKFAVELREIEPAAHGCDGVTYLFEPNPGEPARPLADIASSGETARVMLAVKEALAEHDATDILVFDEIDANIGGEVGAVVGAKLRAVAANHQVIAITHLPQSAACGATHLVVTKRVEHGRTFARVEPVVGEARVAEIARMLGGKAGDKVVRAHAEKLLKNVLSCLASRVS